jgi:hypothetical protein
MDINVTIPTNLSEITLRQYKHFLKIQKKVDDEKFLSAKIIEIFCKVELKDVMNIKFKDSEFIVNTLTDMFAQTPKLVKSFSLNNVSYGFHPQLDDLTLGEYIDLDTYIGDWENIEKAMAVLYRPITSKLKGKYAIAEYDAKENAQILDMPMDAVLSSIFFVEFRVRLVESYDELFGQGGEGGLDSISNFTTKYGWYNAIYGLAQGDIRRFEDITKLGVHECFMMLSYMKDKAEVEAKNIKRNFK